MLRDALGRFAPEGDERKPDEHRRQQARDWHRKNPDKMRAYRKAWLERNREKARESSVRSCRKYRRENRGLL
jgi:hypothetical protein